MHLVTPHVIENQDTFKFSWTYLDFTAAWVFYYWLYIIRCTLQVLYSHILPRAVLAFWRRLTKTKSQHCCWQSMRLNDCYATCALVVKHHVINHHITAISSPCRPIMNCFDNLPFVSFRWWSFIYYGYGRTTNKVTITASCSMSILL